MPHFADAYDYVRFDAAMPKERHASVMLMPC